MMNPSGQTSATIPAYRNLRFRSIDELRIEIDRLAAADRAGTLRCSGQWTAGQVFGHLAAWIEYHFNGYPTEAHPPWLLRAVARVFKPILLRRPMRRGLKIPGVNGGTVGTEPMSIEEGTRRLHAALARLEQGGSHHSITARCSARSLSRNAPRSTFATRNAISATCRRRGEARQPSCTRRQAVSGGGRCGRAGHGVQGTEGCRSAPLPSVGSRLNQCAISKLPQNLIPNTQSLMF